MTTRRRIALGALCALFSSAVWPGTGSAFAHVAIGDVIENEEMTTLDGAPAQLLSKKALANVLVFFRPQQENSLETLKAMAKCEQEFASKPVRFAAIVSSTFPAGQVREAVVEAGIRMPVLIDRDDKVYGRIGVRLHPAIGVTDEKQQLIGYEPFKKVNYCDRIRGKIRYALHEIDLAEVQETEHPRSLSPSGAGAVSNRHVRMGEHFLRSKQYEKAAGIAKGILEKEPDFAPAHVLLGDVLAAEGKCDDAARSYAAALKIDPQNTAAAKGKLTCGQK
jgi:tetratricopeptide (TPR) repeat protein